LCVAGDDQPFENAAKIRARKWLESGLPLFHGRLTRGDRPEAALRGFASANRMKSHD
jgi:hypothetical protein